MKKQKVKIYIGNRRSGKTERLQYLFKLNSRKFDSIVYVYNGFSKKYWTETIDKKRYSFYISGLGTNFKGINYIDKIYIDNIDNLTNLQLHNLKKDLINLKPINIYCTSTTKNQDLFDKIFVNMEINYFYNSSIKFKWYEKLINYFL